MAFRVGLGGLILVAAVATGIGLAALSSSAPAGGPPVLSVLSGPTASLPSEVLQWPGFQQKFGTSPDVHLAAQQGGKSYYVARDAQGALCLLERTDATDEIGYTCADLSVLAERPVFLDAADRGSWDVAGIAPDGFSRASADGVSAAVRNNVFVLSNVSSGASLDVTGSAGSLHANEISDSPPQSAH
jgi:hypothetical protein